MTYEELDNLIKDFQTTSKEYYDGYAYASGYLGSALAGILAEMPEEQQWQHIRHLMAVTSDINQQLVIRKIKDSDKVTV
jgi:hypothetical protein